MIKLTQLIALLFTLISTTTFAQLCTGSLGDPIVEINFGSGSNRGAALGSDITAFTYVASGELDEGEYTIANTTSGLKGNAWHTTTDHTGNENGYMMVINSAVLASEGVFYTKNVTSLCPNTTYEFSAWLINIMNPSAGTDEYHPDVTFRVSDTSGNVLGSYNTGDISQTTSGEWLQYGFFFTLEEESEVIITILNSAPSAHPGNDIALDDITFKPCGPTITTFIEGNNVNEADVCENEITDITLETELSDGYDDPKFQWQTSTDNGNTWTDITDETNSTFIFTDSSTPGIFLFRVAIANGININSSNCRITSDEFTITVIEKPEPLVGEAQQSFCSTQQATLSHIQVNANAIWYDSITKDNVLNENTTLLDGTTYYATQINNGCESDDVLAVQISIYYPTLTFNNIDVYVCDNLNDLVEVIDLTFYESEIANCNDCLFSYFTTTTDAENYSNVIDTPTSYTWYTTVNELYVRIDSSDNCYQIARINLIQQETPEIEIGDYIGICEGDSYVTIDAGNDFDSYLWSTGETTKSINISEDNIGAYWVTVTQNHNSFSCSTTKNFEVLFSNTATISNIDITDWTDTNNRLTIHLTETSLGNYEYSLDGINYQDSNTFTNVTAGEYIVYVSDKNGCGTTEDVVYLLNPPKFFTPNNDGFNDTWHIKYAEHYPEMRITIFNRYGKMLAVLNSTSEWDGTFNGSALPTSDYWFIVTKNNQTVYKGHFTLKR
ncbi:T9SS type B sorting domain-containing protein [Neotamlana laminarinivorans]|uniref:T9SS type B sorting domain-containing protein n=1 Tax=Neotamlana laminarinivorans TaxID=2883124 RepID=A0A9X1I1L8_9FLAO|nr:T9SS type B sorting domain-containing protein [Tamlana laminarinivorans]MCB4798888.1 T9SS type B sorting domain-containing protein [Tamlana laminarinivorans]